jgi:nucleoside-diphosphate-sugar epimerase
MKLLFIGGTGNISASCVELALGRGDSIAMLNRGRTQVQFSQPVTQITGDRHDMALLRRIAQEGHYDVIADFIGYTPEEAEADIQAFTGQTAQFIFVSSVAAYQKPPNTFYMDESTPLRNPFWKYASDKILCEERLLRAYRDDGLPVTIVRPWHTYGETRVPTSIGGTGYTLIDRVRRGQPIVCPDGGQTLWGLTHSDDLAVGFVGLCGNMRAIGEAFHITTEEILTWEQIYRTIARAAGAEANLVYIPRDYIRALYPQAALPIYGDLAYSSAYDNSKIKRFVPAYERRPHISFAEGMRRSTAWLDADPARRAVDATTNAMLDHLIASYQGVVADAESHA